MTRTNRARSAGAISSLAVLTLTAAAVSACGGGNGYTLNSGMTAWGVQNGGYFACYYVYTPLEVTAPITGLIAQGRCPANSVPTLMPESWLDLHYGYYDSAAYYNTYVPSGPYRTHYIAVWGGTNGAYYKSHKTIIINTNKAATNKGTGVAPANPTKNVTFGNGARATQTFGGGARATAPKAVSTYKAPAPKVTFGGGARKPGGH